LLPTRSRGVNLSAATDMCATTNLRSAAWGRHTGLPTTSASGSYTALITASTTTDAYTATTASSALITAPSSSTAFTPATALPLSERRIGCNDH